MLLNCFAVGAGGFVGSVFRYLISLLPLFRYGAFPLQTLLVNVAGSVIIGVLFKASESGAFFNAQTLLFLKVGICGGFTTFSTFSLETAGMLEAGRWLQALVYVLLSVGLCLSGVFAGQWLFLKLSA